jgi:biotin transport system permease protein
VAEVAFHYVNTFTLFHRIDPRSKVLLLIGLSVTGSVSGWPGLFLLSPVILSVLFLIRIPVRRLVREMRAFAFFFLLILAVSTIDFARTETAAQMSLNAGGLLSGLLVVSRMIFVILLAVFFTATTKTREMRDAVWWLFHPVPFINEARAALMFSLSIRFIPLVFDEASMIGMALTARGTTRRPLRRLRLTGIPLILNSFRRVETIVRAMISRCYTDEAVKPRLGFGKRDFLTLTGAAAICIGASIFDKLLS